MEFSINNSANGNRQHNFNESNFSERKNVLLNPAPVSRIIPAAIAAPPDWVPLTVTQARRLTMFTGDDKAERRPVRIYSDGSFDLFHNGHIEQLRQAKIAFPQTYVIAAVLADEDILEYKGTRPVMTVEERCDLIRHCAYVDEVINSPPYWPTIEYMNSIRVDIVAHDAAPYGAPDADDCFAPFKAADRFLATERKPAISTTDLLERIIENFDDFRKRQAVRLEKNAPKQH